VSQMTASVARPRETEDRGLVALACRVMAAAGLFDMHGHISLRDGDVAYINGRRASRISVTPAQVAVVKVADGTVVSGEAPAETALHLGCYRARPEIRSVAHFHPLAATAFATVGKPLITAFNAGAPFGRAVPVYDDPDLVQTDAQGRAMAEDLGKHRAVLLRGHGVAVVADDVPSCVTLSLYLEENAKRLAFAMTIGGNPAHERFLPIRVRHLIGNPHHVPENQLWGSVLLN